MSRTHRRIVAALLVATGSTGCYKWSRPEGSPAEVLQQRSPEKVRLELTDGSKVRLTSIEVRGDSISGSEEVRPAPGDSIRASEIAGARLVGDRVVVERAIALADVAQIKVRKLDGLRTGLLGAGAVLLVVGTLATLAQLRALENLFESE